MVEEIMAEQGELIDKIVFEQVNSLILKDLPNLATFCPGSCIFEWPSLKTLNVDACPKLETLSLVFNAQKLQISVGSEDMHQEGRHDSFMQHPFNGQVSVPLEALNLHNLENLKEICKDPQGILKFQNLSSLTVYKCDCLRNLFSPSMARGLLQLQLLEINSCEMMVEIVSMDESGEASTGNKIVFPEVNTLKLQHLPNLKCFCSLDCAFEWPSLVMVRVEDCPQMRTFSSGLLQTPKLRQIQVGDNKWDWKGDLENTIQHLFTGEVPYSTIEKLCINCPAEMKTILDTKLLANSFGNLKVLEARCIDEKCNVFLSNVLPRSHKLEELFVENIEFLEEVFDLEGFSWEGNAQFLIQLRKLILRDLPRLKNIWNKDPSAILGFQNVREFDVLRCGYLRNLISTSVARSLVQIEVLKIHSCYMMEEIVGETVGEAAAMKKIEFPQLKHLEIVGLSNLISFHSGKCTFEWPFLETLRIECCPLLRTFTAGFLCMHKSMTIDKGLEVTLEGGVPGMLMQCHFNEKVVFPEIKKLHLICLQNFEEIWHGPVPDSSFHKLQLLEVGTCSKLLHVIPLNLLSRLENLEKLTVQNCDMLEHIFELGGLIKIRAVAAVLCRLDELVLTHLPKLMYLVNMDFARVPVFPNIQILKVNGCGCLRYFFSASIARCLKQLKVVEIADCKLLKHIIVKEKEVTDKISFPSLYSLVLEDLPSLTTFSEGSESFEFPSLVTLRISQCPKVKSFSSALSGMSDIDAPVPLFQSNMLISFQKLEKLALEQCDSLREIFDIEGLVMQDKHEPLLPQLSDLVLTHLPKLVHMWNKEPAGILLFQKLISLQVIHCDGLDNLFSLSTARNLIKLQKLKLFGCELMEEVITVEEEESMDEIVFPELECLLLKHLPRLTCFFPGTNTFEWPSLKTVRVKSIPKMEHFAPGVQSTPKLKAIYGNFLEKVWKENLNDTIKHLDRTNDHIVAPQLEAEAVHKSSSGHICKAKESYTPEVLGAERGWQNSFISSSKGQELGVESSSMASTVNDQRLCQGEIVKVEESQTGETSTARGFISTEEQATSDLFLSHYQHRESHDSASKTWSGLPLNTKDEAWTARMTTRMATLMMLIMITTRMEQASGEDHKAMQLKSEAGSKEAALAEIIEEVGEN
ncbi:hypothetical protein F0562_025965 [Nyssa sinensis]|uniref:Disease resistance protein At4g27190-like leucine-rich repeats domain-containing protein n=1 Tax=Nyssa sinensis TaxID=561372 RepID=A0A5J5B7Q6_9ASTE|nr:hypothetical protein F0562_025965 [Nyssa sinensis]